MPGRLGEEKRRRWGCEEATPSPQLSIPDGPYGETWNLYRCPRALLRDADSSTRQWISWASRQYVGWSNGGLSPIDQDERYSCVGFAAFELFSAGAADAHQKRMDDLNKD